MAISDVGQVLITFVVLGPPSEPDPDDRSAIGRWFYFRCITAMLGLWMKQAFIAKGLMPPI